VAVFFKDPSKMILNKVMEKCTTILQAIILKAIGKMTKSKVKEQWIGLILEKNMLVSGKIIINKVGECIYGFSLKAKENILETDMKGIGSME